LFLAENIILLALGVVSAVFSNDLLDLGNFE